MTAIPLTQLYPEPLAARPLRLGDRLRNEDYGSEYIVASCGPGKVILINVKDGNRHGEAEDTTTGTVELSREVVLKLCRRFDRYTVLR